MYIKEIYIEKCDNFYSEKLSPAVLRALVSITAGNTETSLKK